MLRSTALVASVATLGVVFSSRAAATGPAEGWTYVQVDDDRAKWGDFAEPEWLRYFGLDAADMDGDGDLDLLSGRYVYRNPGGSMMSWERLDLGANVDGMLALDVDGDAHADVIAQALPDVIWLEAEDEGLRSWRRTVVGELPKTGHNNGQGYARGDLDGDGRPEVLLAAADGIYAARIPDEPAAGPWPWVRVVTRGTDEGFALADVDGDGDRDIVGGDGPPGDEDPTLVVWWANPGRLEEGWTRQVVGETLHAVDRVAAVDLNGDGRTDVAIAEERYPGLEPDAHLWWYEATADGGASFERHQLIEQYSMNNLDAGDVDGDGDVDLVTGEHKGPHLRLQVFENDGRGVFTLREIDRGKECHLGTRLFDLDGDGDLDIVGHAWDAYQDLHLWRNDGWGDASSRAVAFREVTVDDAGPRDPWTKIGADLDGDGRGDLVVGGREGPLVWYQAPGWEKYVIAEGGWSTVGGAAGDVDGDGDLDVVMGGTLWYENPGGLDATPDRPWAAHRIAEDPTHDVALADLDGDGRMDVATRNQSEFGARAGHRVRLWLQGADGTWRGVVLECPHGEGLALADLDLDGDPDVVTGDLWFETVRSPEGTRWESHPLADTHPNVTVAVADFSGDGRPDVALAPSELAGQVARFSWFEAPSDPRAGPWREHVLVEDQECVVHSLAAADVDGDGRVDILFAEMHQGEDPDVVGAFLNRGGSWTRVVLGVEGSHGLQAVDVDGDGDPDLLGANHGGPRQEVRLWENLTPGAIVDQAAHWVSADTIAWSAAGDPDATFALHVSSTDRLATSAAGIVGGASLPLTPDPAGLPPDVQARFPHLAELPALKIGEADRARVRELLKGQLAVSAMSDEGRLVEATGLQIPGVLDDLYAYEGPLGVTWETGRPTLRVWAPTARSVTLHLFADSDPATTSSTRPMTLDARTGVWSVSGEPDWKGRDYLFEVEVYAPSTGRVERNLVTDPYSVGLSMNSTRSRILDLDDPALQPAGWNTLVKPSLGAPEDITIYEIHVRDFSVSDPEVPETLRGTFKAFTLEDTNGIRHLQALQRAGLTHVHLLPVFDIATVNEDRAEWQAPDPVVLARLPPDSEEQQALVSRDAATDGYNWGYDPYHYTTPEGSYATDPDGPARILEFREMVQALNRRGLRVVMDVVYNHTHAAGQDPGSVLDRIVPGYYHRLDDRGRVETSTCCSNTASEHAMMEKLMVDSLVTWATAYKIDAFRFDLMGHHMKRNMEQVRGALDALTPEKDGVEGRSIYLYGEGWNFGEVADGARGTNATQHNLAGTGIGTFNDRLRDAVRGGGPFDGGDDLIRRQGFANGLWYDPNGLNSASAEERETLLLLADRIRIGMAGNLAGYAFVDRRGDRVTGADVEYKGEPTGYAADPQENVVYVSKHDNQTLYDNNVYKAPLETSMADRVRMQTVGLSTVLLGQGVPFLHAGSDLLRSKSLDRDSYNSGDWFNRLDFTGQVNNFGSGLPVANRNVDDWPVMRPLLARATLRPGPDDMGQMSERFQELLRIRASSKLFRLETASQVQAHVAFHNTGPNQIPGLIVMSLTDDAGAIDPVTERIVVLVNARDDAVDFGVPAATGLDFRLHPVQGASTDPIVRLSTFDQALGSFHVPARTTAVFVARRLAGSD